MSINGLSVSEVVLRLTSACLVGAAVGLDREARQKAAGLRTHILLALGAALFLLLVVGPNPQASASATARVLQGLASGLGFLSAGQILRRGLPIGVTTAADLWVVGALGAACGLGLYGLAIGAAGLVVIVLRGLRLLERRLGSKEAA